MKLITYSWNGLGNIGDDWIAKTIRENLKRKGIESNRITEPSSLDGEAVLGDLQWVRFSKNLKSVLKLRQSLRDFDGMLFAGGGWFAGDQNLRNSIMWLLRVMICPIPIYTIGIGVGPFTNRYQILIFRLISKRVRNFDVRHISDATHLPSLGISQFTVSHDLIFLDLANPIIRQVVERELCLVVLPSWAKHRGKESLQDLGMKIRKNLNSYGIVESEIYFVSFQISPFDDYLAWSEIFPNRLIAENIVEMTHIFSRAKYVVAGRLHAGLAAFKFAVPNVAVIPYHSKFKILEDMGAYSPENDEELVRFVTPNYSEFEDRQFSMIECFEVITKRIYKDLVGQEVAIEN